MAASTIASSGWTMKMIHVLDVSPYMRPAVSRKTTAAVAETFCSWCRPHHTSDMATGMTRMIISSASCRLSLTPVSETDSAATRPVMPAVISSALESLFLAAAYARAVTARITATANQLSHHSSHRTRDMVVRCAVDSEAMASAVTPTFARSRLWTTTAAPASATASAYARVTRPRGPSNPDSMARTMSSPTPAMTIRAPTAEMTFSTVFSLLHQGSRVPSGAAGGPAAGPIGCPGCRSAWCGMGVGRGWISARPSPNDGRAVAPRSAAGTGRRNGLPGLSDGDGSRSRRASAGPEPGRGGAPAGVPGSTSIGEPVASAAAAKPSSVPRCPVSRCPVSR